MSDQPPAYPSPPGPPPGRPGPHGWPAGPSGPPPDHPPGPPGPRLLGFETEPEPETGKRRLPLVALLVGVGLAVVLLTAAVLVPMLDEPTPTLSDVTVHEDLDPSHVAGEVEYPQSPAVGGPHAAQWLECGVYDQPVREENVVHDLEHGTFWITYRPDLAEDDVEDLAGLLPENGILSPYPDLAAPVVVTVWGRQLRLDGVDDPRLPLFLQEYAGGATAPEPFASCHGGLQDPDGGMSSGTAV